MKIVKSEVREGSFGVCFEDDLSYLHRMREELVDLQDANNSAAFPTEISLLTQLIDCIEYRFKKDDPNRFFDLLSVSDLLSE